MKNLELSYEIIPGMKTSTDLVFQDQPMAFEKDEIKLRTKFWYKQAFFFKPKALLAQNISDVLWIEDNLNNILSQAANETHTDKESVYESQTYCLNVNYKFQNTNK